MAGKKVDGGTVTIKVTDGDSLKDIQKKVKKARGEFDGLATSTQAADRAGKGLSKQSSNQTKNFSKMQQGISGGIVPAYATLAANVFALSAAFQFLQTSMNTRNMIEGQKAFGSITGVAYGTITDSIRKATQGQLAFKEAAEAAAIGTAAGLNRDQLERLGTAATNVSIALGRDLADSFNRLVRGVTKAEPELLDELGIVLRLDPALRAYAVSIGKSVANLNQFEKSQAIANEVLDQAERKFGAIQEVMEPGAFAMGQFTSSFNDLLDVLKNALGGLAQTVLPFFTDNVAALASALGLVAVPILKIILPNFEAMSVNAAKNVEETKASLRTLQDEMNQTALASQAIAAGDTGKLGAKGAKYTKGKLKSLAIKGKGADGNLNQAQVAAYRRTWEQKKGIWKKMTKQEQLDFKASLDQMDLAHKVSTGKQKLETTKSELKKRNEYTKTKVHYTNMQLQMTKIGQKSAKLMSNALKAAGYIGIITMLGSLVVSIIQSFKKISPLEEARQKSLKEQSEVNSNIVLELEKMIELREKEVLILQKGKLEREKILRFNTELNMQTAQAMQSTALGAQAQKYGNTFNRNAPRREVVYTGDEALLGIQASAFGDEIAGFQRRYTDIFKGDAGEAQKALGKSFNRMAEMISPDYEFKNIEGVLTNARAAYEEYAATILSGEELSLKQLKNLANLENQYQSLASKVRLAGEVQKTYDRNLVSMGGKGRFGRAMRNSIAEQEVSLAAQLRMEKLGNEQGEVDSEKITRLEDEIKLIGDFKDDLEKVLKLDTAIVNTRHKLNMSLEKAKVTREFEANMAELSLKDEAKRVQVLESEKALAMAIASQKALGAASTQDDKDDAKENVRQARQKLELSKEQLRIQKLLTIEAEKQARINKFGEELKQLRDITKQFRKFESGKLYDENPFFKDMSKQTKGVVDRQLNPRDIQEDYDDAIAKAYNDFQKGMMKDGLTEDEKFMLTEELRLQGEIALHTKKMAQRTEAERAVDLAAAAGGKALEGGMTTGLMKVAKGDMKAKDAAKEVALGVAEAIVQSMIQSLVSNLLGDLLAKLAITATLETTSQAAMASLSGVIAANTVAVGLNTGALHTKAIFGRTGGVFEAGKKVQGYSSGGIAKGSTAGYPAILHGKEAVIPIPSGDKIPVEVKGGTMTNSVVNVTVNSDGSSSMDAEKATALGKGIQNAVQIEIAKQQRYGGLLSGK